MPRTFRTNRRTRKRFPIRNRDGDNIFIKEGEWGHLTRGPDSSIGLDPKGKALQDTGRKRKKAKKRKFESGFGF